MNDMKPRYEVTVDGKPLKLYTFSNPMMHEDWHKAEAEGLVYAYYLHHWPDYWDDELVFCKEEDLELAEQHLRETAR